MHWNHQHRTKRLYHLHQYKLNQMPQSSAPRQFVTLWHITAMHQSTAVKDPPCPGHQKHKTQTHIVINWYHHPHWQEAEVYSTSCNSCWEENELSRFFCMWLPFTTIWWPLQLRVMTLWRPWWLLMKTFWRPWQLVVKSFWRPVLRLMTTSWRPLMMTLMTHVMTWGPSTNNYCQTA